MEECRCVRSTADWRRTTLEWCHSPRGEEINRCLLQTENDLLECRGCFWCFAIRVSCLWWYFRDSVCACVFWFSTKHGDNWKLNFTDDWNILFKPSMRNRQEGKQRRHRRNRCCCELKGPARVQASGNHYRNKHDTFHLSFTITRLAAYRLDVRGACNVGLNCVTFRVSQGIWNVLQFFSFFLFFLDGFTIALSIVQEQLM